MSSAPDETFSDNQKIVLSVISKCSSLLSIIGSLYIGYHCASSSSTLNRRDDSARNRFYSAEYNRILFALSLCDFISSLAFFTSPWAIPADETKERSFLNVGNQLTCNMQGAMFQLGLMGGLNYNACLAIYFYIFVRYKIKGINPKSESENETNDLEKSNYIIWTRTKKEIILHCSILIVPFLSAIILVLKGYMNPSASIHCWINEFPRGCEGEECIRGKNTTLIRILFMQIPLIVCMTIIVLTMILLHRSVRKFSKHTMNKNSDNKISVHAHDPAGDNENNIILSISHESDEDPTEISEMEEKSSLEIENTLNQMNDKINKVCQKIRRLSLLYLFAILSVWMPMLIQTSITKLFVNDPQVYYYSVIILMIFSPLQGAFNALIFGDFNPLFFLYRHILAIMGLALLSVVLYLVLCDVDTCFAR